MRFSGVAVASHRNNTKLVFGTMLSTKLSAVGRTRNSFLRKAIQSVVLMLGDLTAFVLAMVFALLHSPSHPSVAGFAEMYQGKYLVIYALLMGAWIFWLGFVKQVYIRRRPFWTELWQLFVGVFTFAVVNAALGGIVGAYHIQTWLFEAWLALFILLPVARHVSQVMLMRLNLWCIPTVIIGQGENAKEAYLALQSEPGMGFKVHAFIQLLPQDERRARVRAQSPMIDIPIVSIRLTSSDIEQLQGFQCVIAMEANENKLRDTVIRLLNHIHVSDVHVIPSMRGVPLYGMETFNFFSHEVLLIQLRNNSASALHRASKRLFDLVVSLALLLLLSPLFALLAYQITRDGGGVFFAHERVGRFGKLFKCYKFRSMVVNSKEVLANLLATDPAAKAEWNKDFKLKNDPRINELGALIRRTSLDELPQLFNVLIGDMSLVGPRPVVQDELERYGDDIDYYLMARPGITGLWQVSGRNDVDYSTRVYLDAWYVKNWSLWSDVAILFKTVSVVFGRKGAY